MLLVPLPKDAHQTKTYEITASMDISMVTSSINHKLVINGSSILDTKNIT